MIDAIELQIGPVDLALRGYARKQPGCRTLIDQIYGFGSLTSILAELGDTRALRTRATRFGTPAWSSPSTKQISAVPQHLSRQGPPALRWALSQAAQAARRPSSPARPYNEQLAERIGANRACVAIARKLVKRSDHVLRGLSDQALEPVTA